MESFSFHLPSSMIHLPSFIGGCHRVTASHVRKVPLSHVPCTPAEIFRVVERAYSGFSLRTLCIINALYDSQQVMQNDCAACSRAMQIGMCPSKACLPNPDCLTETHNNTDFATTQCSCVNVDTRLSHCTAMPLMLQHSDGPVLSERYSPSQCVGIGPKIGGET